MSTGAAAGAAGKAPLSIGDVLALLRPEFPDVTISKIRFLEAEGLLEPQRTPSGYRKFRREDVERLRYVLSAQRNHYLPLRVIKDNLDALDRGLELPGTGTGTGAGRPQAPESGRAQSGQPGPESFRPSAAELRLSRDELVDAAGIDQGMLVALEGYGLVSARSGHYDDDALQIARTVASMSEFGLEPRHLRAFTTAAEREAGLIDQVITPLRRQRDAEARGRAEQASRDLAALSVRLHILLVRVRLHR